MPSLITSRRSTKSPVRTQAKLKLPKSFWGLARRRECLVPTGWGWLMVTIVSIALVVAGVLTIHPFLAVTAPITSGVLVVEGWAPDYVLEEAKALFERDHYARLYVTGGPLERGAHLSELKTYAELGAATLIRMGMAKDAIEAVPAPMVRQDRTYTSGVTLKNWLRQHSVDARSVNVVSLGAHARRSQLLFQMAFGEGSRVGIIAVEDRNYDPRHWWKFSQGVRMVVDELVAYIYAVFVFPWNCLC